MLACVVLLLVGAVTVMGRSDGLEEITAMQEKMYEKLNDIEKTVNELKNGMMSMAEGSGVTSSSGMRSGRGYAASKMGRSTGRLSTSGMTHGHSGRQSMGLADFMGKSNNKFEVSGPGGEKLSEDDPMYKKMKESFASGNGFDLGSLFSGTTLTADGKSMDLGSMMDGASVKFTGPDGQSMSKDDPRVKSMMDMATGGSMNFASMLQNAMGGDQSQSSGTRRSSGRRSSSSFAGPSLFG